MSEGFHAKISMFWRRNSTSSLSYLLFKLEPSLICLEESPGTRSTFLVSCADWNDGSWSETCFFVVCISSRFTMASSLLVLLRAGRTQQRRLLQAHTLVLS